MTSWLLYSLLIGIAGYTDWRWRIVPNALSWIAIGYLYAMVGHHWWGWNHVWWALGIWLVFEVLNILFPQGVGYGDFKVAAWTLAFWPGWGIVLVLAGSVWTIVYGFLSWWPHRREKSWQTATAPWVVGVTLLWFLILVNHP